MILAVYITPSLYICKNHANYYIFTKLFKILWQTNNRIIAKTIDELANHLMPFSDTFS